MHFLSMTDFGKDGFLDLLKTALDIKKDPKKYSKKLEGKSLLMIFQKPSLRTRLSFEIGMTQMGGHGIYYSTSESTLGSKEDMKEFSRVISRYADIAMLRLNSHEDLLKFVRHSSIPVINGLTDFSHPCQIASDLMTIYEKKKKLKGLKLAFVGDGDNNVTNSLLFGCALVGMDISIGSPKKYQPKQDVIAEAIYLAEKSGSSVEIDEDPLQAVKNADVIYTDTWMSYGIPESDKKKRYSLLKKYQVNSSLMNHTKNALFMHCLPAKRGEEVTDEVIDSKNSVIIDQAENRLHMQKAIILKLLEKI